MDAITSDLLAELQDLRFSAPVSHVYNPLAYARRPYALYQERYGQRPKEVVLLGMNPGPWGMAQTGVPFGEVGAVRGWLGIEAAVQKPTRMHPKRPIEGFACRKSEVSGRRLWGWAKATFETPQRFFKRFFVANYCPLVFMEKSGRNLTPDKLRVSERTPLLEICDRALLRTIEYLEPVHVIGVGAFTATRAGLVLDGKSLKIGRITHPSPANPLANKGWAQRVQMEMKQLGIRLL
jgi:single-strand selective monofunctional uracil DNA glycosylase